MRRFHWISIVAFAFVVMPACTSRPDSVCEHLIKLSERQWGELDREGPGLRAAALKSCVAEKSALKTSDPRAYECLADCVTSKSVLVDVADCEKQCGIPAKSPPPGAASEEPVDGIPGLWTDPYADAREDSGSGAD